MQKTPQNQTKQESLLNVDVDGIFIVEVRCISVLNLELEQNLFTLKIWLLEMMQVSLFL